MNKNWLKQKESFVEFDVRTLKGNFLSAIIKKAKAIRKGEGTPYRKRSRWSILFLLLS
jgi:hypothetical protein